VREVAGETPSERRGGFRVVGRRSEQPAAVREETEERPGTARVRERSFEGPLDAEGVAVPAGDSDESFPRHAPFEMKVQIG
jgi:hypothetical protein